MDSLECFLFVCLPLVCTVVRISIREEVLKLRWIVKTDEGGPQEVGMMELSVLVYDIIKNKNLNLKMIPSANDTLLSKESDLVSTERRNQNKLENI